MFGFLLIFVYFYPFLFNFINTNYNLNVYDFLKFILVLTFVDKEQIY